MHRGTHPVVTEVADAPDEVQAIIDAAIRRTHGPVEEVDVWVNYSVRSQKFYVAVWVMTGRRPRLKVAHRWISDSLEKVIRKIKSGLCS